MTRSKLYSLVNWISVAVIIIAVAHLVWVEFQKPQINYRPLQTNNSCVPNAILFQESYFAATETNEALKKNRWSRVMAVMWVGDIKHAVTVFEWKGVLYAYDATMGSTTLTTDLTKKDNVVYLGVIFSMRLNQVCTYAAFID